MAANPAGQGIYPFISLLLEVVVVLGGSVRLTGAAVNFDPLETFPDFGSSLAMTC